MPTAMHMTSGDAAINISVDMMHDEMTVLQGLHTRTSSSAASAAAEPTGPI